MVAVVLFFSFFPKGTIVTCYYFQVFISFAKMQADVTEGVPTDSIAHQLIRNKRKRKGKF